MKDLLLLFSIVAVCTAFIINQSQKRDPSYTLTSTGTCSDERFRIVNQSIQQCQIYGYSYGPLCIKTYIENNTHQQKWNVVGQSNLSDAQMSYWFYNDCSFRYQLNQTIKQRFTIWKASQSPSSEKISNKQNREKKNELRTLGDEDCTPERLSAAFYAINYCQNNETLLQVICIKNNIMTKIGQKWDALVWTKTALSYRYDYYDNCNFRINSYGHNSRNYLVWKAQ